MILRSASTRIAEAMMSALNVTKIITPTAIGQA